MEQSNSIVQFGLYVVVAIVVYAAAVQLAFWQMPRRRHWGPGVVVSLSGALVGVLIVGALWPQTPMFGVLFGAALGALGFVFAAVKVGTPASVVLSVNCDVDTELEKALHDGGDKPPFVWPYHLAIEKQGSVIWELCGKPGTTVVIEFPEDNTPFGCDASGKPRTRFEGQVPGRIVAAPTTTPGRGEYTVKMIAPDGAASVGDPSWDLPRRWA